MEKLVVEAKIENLSKVLEFIDTHLEQTECSMKAQMQIDVSVEELFVNIASYAYENCGDAVITYNLLDNPKAVEITMIDRGVPYNPLAHEDPDITLSAADRDIGGLGILMVKKNMDDVRYEYVDGENRTTIYKLI